MSSTIEKLKRILLLESRQGFTNHAVMGGLNRFVSNWAAEVRTDPDGAGDWAVEVVALLSGYDAMSADDRERAVRDALERLPDEAPEGEPHRTPNAVRDRPAASPRAAGNGGRPDGDEVTLRSPLTAIKGISTVYQERLARLGLHTIKDLIYHLPRRYDDYSALKTINRLELGDEVTIVGTVRNVRTQRTRTGQPVVRVALSDGTGVIEASWFGQPYLARRFRQGAEIVVSGQVDQYLGRLVFSSPEWEPLQRQLLHTNRLVPVYPLTSGVSARRLRSLIKATLDHWAPLVVDPLPPPVIDSAGLMPLGEALQQIHFPEGTAALERARRRLCFDEFFFLQIGVLRQRSAWRRQQGLPLEVPREEIEGFVGSLPFALTDAQRRALESILADLEQPVPMRRLLQGDVGSGKTVVAVAAILAAVRNGYQAAIMAPTAILAEQHHATVCEMLAGHPDVRCELLVGSLGAAEKERIQRGAAAGEIDLLVGTHALIQETVTLPNLGFVVVDEQHRFGVLQRAALAERGRAQPHVLAMSATPIPRSLAMTIYGDLDISALDELPPGRQQVITAVRDNRSRERIYSFMESQIRQGRQAFVVCPLIEEAEGSDARAAISEHQRLQRQVFPHLRVGLLHGRMSEDEKEATMASFQRGECDILVSTTVIEVGIDIPNATVMLVEDAERFGLAQLHQLRGRVGRSEHRSYCILLSEDSSAASMERLAILEETTDGFRLAEKDLEMRGPGDFFGVRQHGLPELKVARLSDTAVLEVARREALRLFEQDPDLAAPEHRALALSVDHFWAPENGRS